MNKQKGRRPKPTPLYSNGCINFMINIKSNLLYCMIMYLHKGIIQVGPSPELQHSGDLGRFIKAWWGILPKSGGLSINGYW